MATIIWCDRVRHIVEDSRTDVERIISTVINYRPAFSYMDATGERVDVPGTNPDMDPMGFGFFTPLGSPTQRALNVRLISSFEAVPGDGI